MANGLTEMVWGDGPQRFVLNIDQLYELQDKCGSGPQRVLERLSGKDWMIADIRETVRLGLIGGGKSPSEAFTLVSRYIDKRPTGLLESRFAAVAVLAVALTGDPDDPVGEHLAEETPQPVTAE